MSQNIIFGKKAILDAIKNNINIECIYCLKIPNELKSTNIKIKVVNKNFFNDYKNINHQQIVAKLNNNTIKHIDFNELINRVNTKENFCILMVDECQDPGNFGAIIRNAVAFNVDVIIYKNKNQVPINDLVIKTSMGCAYHIDFIKVANLNQTIDKLKDIGFWIYATGLTNQAININNVDFNKKAVIIVGNENYGISELTLKKSDYIIKINMSNKVQSLNIASATAIVLNKYFNQKNK